jgi:pSer/pThr/pTyr-binding forkhead associated (FHA) protein
LECQVQLNDPQCSRVHAKIVSEEGRWVIVDAGSRNGTLVNGSKVDTAVLASGNRIRIGNTDLQFVDDSITDDVTVERINLSHDLLSPDGVSIADGIATGMTAFLQLRNAGRVDDLADLHQLSVKCISISQGDELAKIAIEVLRTRTQATVVAFLIANEYGRLDVQHQYPSSAETEIVLSGCDLRTADRSEQNIWGQQDDWCYPFVPRERGFPIVCLRFRDCCREYFVGGARASQIGGIAPN